MSPSPFDSSDYKLGRASQVLARRLRNLERNDSAIYEIKTTTGDPTPRGNFHFVINTFDNNVKVYADGGWRQLASW